MYHSDLYTIPISGIYCGKDTELFNISLFIGLHTFNHKEWATMRAELSMQNTAHWNGNF